MTIGSYTNDQTTQQAWYDAGSYGGLSPVGRFRQKSWNGIDTPPRELLMQNLADGVVERYTDHRGRERYYYTNRRSPKRARRLEEHPYSMSAIDEFHPACNFSLVGDYGGTRNFTNVSPFRIHGGYSAPGGGGFAGSASVEFSANDEINLVNKLKVAVRGSDFNMGTFLGEGHETMRMIGDSALTIASSLRSLRKGDVHEATRVLLNNGKSPRGGALNGAVRRETVDQLSNNWLALSWGWIPLLQDMRSGAELLAHKLNVPFSRRVRVAATKRAAHANVYATMAGGWFARKQIIAILSEPESIPKMMGLLDPEVIAWELFPFSMLVDYVTPIGSWLEARAFASSLSGKFVTTTIKECVVRSISFDKSYERVPGYVSHYEGDTGGAFRRSIDLSRVVSTSLEVPKPAVKPLDKIFSFRHCVNAIALLAQVAKGPLNRADDSLLTEALRRDPTRRELRSQIHSGDNGRFRFM